ncbi:MAG: SCO family protein [Beijerinckiaceae bacterium]
MKLGRILLAFGTVAGALAFFAAILVTMTGGRDRPAIGGPFRLKSHIGETIDSVALKGHPYAVFFGFAGCPEVCPTTMLDMQRLLDRMGPPAQNFRVYFVSVDPERDTPEMLRYFLASFAPYIVGLTGTPAEIAGMAKSFGAYYRKVPTTGGDYTMDHSAFVYLMDATGNYVESIGYQEPEDRALAKLRALLGGSS